MRDDQGATSLRRATIRYENAKPGGASAVFMYIEAGRVAS